MLGPHFFVPLSLRSNVAVYLFSVVMVVGKRRINAGQSQVWVLRDNLLGTHALPFVHNNDVLYLDAASSDAWFAAAGVTRGDNILSDDG